MALALSCLSCVKPLIDECRQYLRIQARQIVPANPSFLLHHPGHALSRCSAL
jgi:hypothetical protein